MKIMISHNKTTTKKCRQKPSAEISLLDYGCIWKRSYANTLRNSLRVLPLQTLSNFRWEKWKSSQTRPLFASAFQFKISLQKFSIIARLVFYKAFSQSRLKRHCSRAQGTRLAFVEMNWFVTQAKQYKQYKFIWKKYHCALKKHSSVLSWLNLISCDICMYRLFASI